MSILSTVNYDIEFKSKKDDAWYNCGVVLEDGNRLRVKFKDFVQSWNDEVFSVTNFSTNDEIAKFLRRFRQISEPIDDNECSRIVEGMIVCAAYTGDKQLRYFDAVVDAVDFKEHAPETCTCTYILCWLHGPVEGYLTKAKFEDIYRISIGDLDPAILNFTELVKDQIKRDSFEFTLIPKNPLLSRKTSSNETITKSQDFGSAGDSSHYEFSAGGERFFLELIDDYKDMGGVKQTESHHYIILENLEKDLCPLLMTDFLHEQTSITAQAFVFPSLSTETSARGAILVNSLTKIRMIYDFIRNPNHFIVSFSGRPWVIAEDKLRTGTFNANLHNFQPTYERYNTTQNLKAVRLGSEEYSKAKKLKTMYVEFQNHVKGLVQRLAMEDEKISNNPFKQN